MTLVLYVKLDTLGGSSIDSLPKQDTQDGSCPNRVVSARSASARKNITPSDRKDMQNPLNPRSLAEQGVQVVGTTTTLTRDSAACGNPGG